MFLWDAGNLNVCLTCPVPVLRPWSPAGTRLQIKFTILLYSAAIIRSKTMQAGRISARDAVSWSVGRKALPGNGPVRFERETKKKCEVDRNEILLFFDNYYKNTKNVAICHLSLVLLLFKSERIRIICCIFAYNFRKWILSDDINTEFISWIQQQIVVQQRHFRY